MLDTGVSVNHTCVLSPPFRFLAGPSPSLHTPLDRLHPKDEHREKQLRRMRDLPKYQSQVSKPIPELTFGAPGSHPSSPAGPYAASPRGT